MTSLVKRPFLLEECNVIRKGFRDLLKIPAIVELLNAMPCNEEQKRCNQNVTSFIREMRMTRRHTELRRSIIRRVNEFRNTELEQDYQFRTGDLKFKMAMLAAIHSGAEAVKAGVVKDRSPFQGKFMTPAPMISLCGSSASYCAEVGSSVPDRISELHILSH